MSAVLPAVPAPPRFTLKTAKLYAAPLNAAPPNTAPPNTAPPNTAPLSPGQLVAFAQFLAREIRAGAHVADFDPDRRWHRRLYRDGRVDVWLISWLPEQGTQLHDHGGSSGAFTVIEGQLSEAVHVRQGTAAGSLRERRHRTGATVGFDGRHVHDVRNLDTRPAVSVHAYSPPLTSMTFYDLEGSALVPYAALDTDDPEPTMPAATEPAVGRTMSRAAGRGAA